jgi:hypothetical protein
VGEKIGRVFFSKRPEGHASTRPVIAKAEWRFILEFANFAMVDTWRS